MKPQCLMFSALAFLLGVTAYAQRERGYDRVVVLQTRIDARDLGYPPIDVIPDGESGITSLTVAPNGNLYGATSGIRSHLFVLVPRHGDVQPVGVIPGANSVTNALAVSGAGDVYMGTAPGGHLLKYTPEPFRQIQIGQPLPAIDLGQPVAGESIFTLTIDRDANVIYGLTSPNAHFFEYEIATGKFSDWGVIAEALPPGEKFEKDRMMSRMLVVDPNGRVYASGENGAIFRFDPRTQNLENLRIQAPAIPGREPWTRVDAFLLDPTGVIYGGTSDGYLFRFNPGNLTVANFECEEVFFNQPLIVRHDPRHSQREARYYALGRTDQDRLLFAAFTVRRGLIRVISAREMTRRERRFYETYGEREGPEAPSGL